VPGLFLAVALAAASSAPTPAQKDEARELSRRSIVEYNAGEFDKALVDITRAYELDPRPGLLYNLAQCHRALEHWKQAKFFFEGYLRGMPQAANRKQVVKLIAEAQEKIDEQERKEAAVREALTAPAPTQTPVPIIISPSAPEAPVPAVVVFGEEPAVKPQGRGAKVAGWTLVGLGLAAGVGGGVWGGYLLANQPGTTTPPAGYPSGTYYGETKAAVDSYNTQAVASDVTWGIGAALVVAGAIVLLAAH